MASAAPAADGGTARARRAEDDKAERALQDKLVEAVTRMDVSDAVATAAMDAAFGGGGAERRAGLRRLAAAFRAEVRDELDPAVEAERKRRAAPEHPAESAGNAAKASTPVATPTSSPVPSDDDEAKGSGRMDDESATSPARVALKARSPPARTPQSASGDARRVKPGVPGLQIPKFG